MKQYYWINKKGEKINVDDLSLEYLRNILKMLLRNKEKIKPVECIDFEHIEITTYDNMENMEPYCDDWMWK